MSIVVHENALAEGGVLAVLPRWRGARSELRVTVRISKRGRVYDLREWIATEDPFRPGHLVWTPARRGASNLAGSELRALLRLLEAAVDVIPSRGKRRAA